MIPTKKHTSKKNPEYMIFPEVKTPDIMLTSAEWYKLDKNYDIIIPTGWTEMTDDPEILCDYWFDRTISYTEYKARRDKSAVRPYNASGHKHPYNRPCGCFCL